MQGRTERKANDRREERSMKALTRTTSAVAKAPVYLTLCSGPAGTFHPGKSH